jgi:hypothetical protein
VPRRWGGDVGGFDSFAGRRIHAFGEVWVGSPGGPLRLLAGADYGTETYGVASIHVTGAGDGFPVDLATRLGRFSRGYPARSGKGTRLGIAIVAAIVQAQGGNAGARNLPRRRSRRVDLAAAAPEPWPEAGDAPDRHRLRAP